MSERATPEALRALGLRAPTHRVPQWAFDAQAALRAAADTIEALGDEVDETRLRLWMLAEAVGDFHTAITCTDSDLVIPDMLAALGEELSVARAFLARLDQEGNPR